MPIANVVLHNKIIVEDTCPDTITILQGDTKKALLKLGASAYIVFSEYLLEAEKPYNVCDCSNDHIAARLDWPVTKIIQAKKKLIAAKWFREFICVPIGRNKKQAPETLTVILGVEKNEKLRLSTFRIDSTKYYSDLSEEEQDEE